MENKNKKEHLLALFKHCPLCGSQDFYEKDEKSKRCKLCGFEYYLNPSAATVAIIINERGELLTLRRSKEPARGSRDLPGGFCDCGETAEEGLMREVLEETGLEVDDCHYLFSLPNIYLYSGMEIHTMDLFFACHVVTGKVPVAHDDAESLEWIPWKLVEPDDFGLHSIRTGLKRMKKMFEEKKFVINKVKQ